jgi:hypothetical protein
VLENAIRYGELIKGMGGRRGNCHRKEYTISSWMACKGSAITTWTWKDGNLEYNNKIYQINGRSDNEHLSRSC